MIPQLQKGRIEKVKGPIIPVISGVRRQMPQIPIYQTPQHPIMTGSDRDYRGRGQRNYP